MEHSQWLPKIENLNIFSEESYKLICKEAKEKFEETISHSEDITSKSIKLISALVLTAPFIIGLNLKNICCLYFIISLALAYIIDFYILVKLLFPKSIITRGFDPKDIFDIPLQDGKYEDNDKILALYYGIIVKLQDGITYNRNQNSKRVILYKNALIISALIFIVGVSIGVFSHL